VVVAWPEVQVLATISHWTIGWDLGSSPDTLVLSGLEEDFQFHREKKAGSLTQ
jgi:hypothetical protein